MKVPFVDLPKQIKKYSKEIKLILEDVIFKRADFIMRQDLIDFENHFAEYIGVNHAIGVANGSDALNLSLKVLGIGKGDEVITVSHTFIATLAAIYHAGATPVLVDVAYDYNIDVDQIENAINKNTKAIIPVHLNGRVCSMKKILEIAEKYNLAIIEDSAQAIGAMYENKKAGSFGILSTNSFYPFKLIGCFGDGGMITTNNPDLDYKLRCLRDNGQDREKGEILYWGWNSRLDNLHAAILDLMLKYLHDIIKNRRKVAKLYHEGLMDIQRLILPPGPTTKDKYYDVFQNYVIRTKFRDELVEYLNEHGVGTLISWPKPSHFHKNLGLTKFKLSNTENISNEVVSLPMNDYLIDSEAAYVVKVIRDFFSKKVKSYL